MRIFICFLFACAAAAPSDDVRPDTSPPPDTAWSCTGACAEAACIYEGYVCGTYFDVGGTPIECGPCAGVSLCDVSHQCVIDRDAREPNDALARATWLGDFDDMNDPYVRVDDLSIDSPRDEDWFQLRISDGFDAGNPRVTIALASARHELAVWFRCDTHDLATLVRCGEAAQNTLSDPALGLGCMIDAIDPAADFIPRCEGIADSGILTLRVRSHVPPRGELYDLRIAVE